MDRSDQDRREGVGKRSRWAAFLDAIPPLIRKRNRDVEKLAEEVRDDVKRIDDEFDRRFKLRR